MAASAGNHAQGVALAAGHLGIRARIVMPRTTPAIKVAAVRALGRRGAARRRHFADAAAPAPGPRRDGHDGVVHPFDDLDVIAGQGTVGIEIIRQRAGSIGAIYVPVGGGGLVAGIGAVVQGVLPGGAGHRRRARWTPTRMSRSMAAGPRRGGGPGRACSPTAWRCARSASTRFAIARPRRRIVRVDNDEICAAMKDVFEDTRAIVEPAGALAVAAIKRDIAAGADRPGRPGGGAHRRQHGFRPAALRGRTRRVRRSPRGHLRRGRCPSGRARSASSAPPSTAA